MAADLHLIADPDPGNLDEGRLWDCDNIWIGQVSWYSDDSIPAPIMRLEEMLRRPRIVRPTLVADVMEALNLPDRSVFRKLEIVSRPCCDWHHRSRSHDGWTRETSSRSIRWRSGPHCGVILRKPGMLRRRQYAKRWLDQHMGQYVTTGTD